MCNVVVDANVFRAFYEEDLGLGSPRPERTGPASEIFDFSTDEANVFLDDGGQIEFEWRKQCYGGEEWFDAWLSENLANGKINLVSVTSFNLAAKKCHNKGFPAGSKDIWYIKTAYAANEYGVAKRTFLVSEDIDFYDPSKKMAASKKKIILAGKGPVAAHLKKDNIEVTCLSSFATSGC